VLHSLDDLLREGQSYKLDFIRPLHRSKDSLARRLSNLKFSGSTALGPALAIATGIAAQAPHSEVIICTDGTSNIGVGMTGVDDLFYPKIGEIAKSNSTIISVIGIEGQDCGVTALQPAAGLLSFFSFFFGADSSFGKKKKKI
jgi:Mg-chelatase subunit ChlD